MPLRVSLCTSEYLLVGVNKANRFIWWSLSAGVCLVPTWKLYCWPQVMQRSAFRDAQWFEGSLFPFVSSFCGVSCVEITEFWSDLRPLNASSYSIRVSWSKLKLTNHSSLLQYMKLYSRDGSTQLFYVRYHNLYVSGHNATDTQRPASYLLATVNTNFKTKYLELSHAASRLQCIWWPVLSTQRHIILIEAISAPNKWNQKALIINIWQLIWDVG